MPIVYKDDKSKDEEPIVVEDEGLDDVDFSELAERAAEIAEVDPQLAEEAEAAARPEPDSVWGRIKNTVLGGIGEVVEAPVIREALKAVSTPNVFVQGFLSEAGLSEEDDALGALKAGVKNVGNLWGDEKVQTYGDALEEAFPGNEDPVMKWAKRIGGVAGAAADPALPLTAGPGGASRAAAKAAGVAALKKAAPELGEEVAESAARKLLANRNLATNVEDIAKTHPEALKVLPKVTQGGFRYGKEGPAIIPGALTRKVSAPVGNIVRKVTDPVVDALTPMKMQRKSPEGWKATELFRESKGTTQALQHAGQEAARKLHRAFDGMADEEIEAAVRAGSAANKAQNDAIAAWTSFRDQAYDTARQTGDLAYREDPIPRQFTDEFMKRKSGETAGETGVDPFLDSLGGHAKERGLGEMSLDEAEAFLRHKHNLAPDFPVYERNPLKAMSRYALDFPERMKYQRFGEGLRDEGILRTRNDLRDATLPAGTRSTRPMGDPDLLARLGVDQFDDGARQADDATQAYYDALNARGGKVPTGEQMKQEAALKRAMDAAREVVKENEPVGHIPEGWAGIGKSKYFAPKEVADFIANEMRPKPPANALSSGWKDYIKSFKAGVYAPWPASHTRNAYSSQTQNAVRGGYVDGLRSWRALSKAADDDVPKGFEHLGMTAGQIRALADQDIGSSALGQLEEFAGQGRRGLLGRGAEHVSPSLARKMGPLGESGGVTRSLRYPEKVMSTVERAARMPAYLHALKTWGDPYAARLYTMAAHGDYTEFAPLERHIRDYGIPFYKWVRTNLPHQAQMLMERPAKATLVPRMMESLDENEDTLMTDQQADSNAFMLDGKFTSVDLPMNDLNQWMQPGPGGLPFPDPRAGIAGANPVIKGLYEAVSGHDPFFNDEAQEFPVANGAWMPIAQALEKIPGGERVVQRSQGGELRISNNVMLLGEAMPTARILSTVRQLTNDKPLQDQLASVLGGVRIESPSPFEQFNREDILDDLTGQLYQRGYGDELEADSPFRP